MERPKVIFIYCEASCKWDVLVSGVADDVEARQAFNAVVITCQDATPKLDANKASLASSEPNVYRISIGQ